MTDMTQAPTPGLISADDAKLLVKGDLLLCKTWGVVRFDRFDDSGVRAFVLDLANDQVRLMKPINMAFVGRPDADGWMPWSGGENPVPGQSVEVKFQFGGSGAAGVSCEMTWPHDGTAGDIIAFRLAPTAPVEPVRKAYTLPEHVKKAAENEHVAAPVEASGSERIKASDVEKEAGYRMLVEGVQGFDSLSAAKKTDILNVLCAALRPQPSGETRGAPVWIKPMVAALEGYEADYGGPLDDMHELGRIDDSRSSPSFRIRVGHVRALALLSARPAPVASGGQHSSGEVDRGRIEAIVREAVVAASVEVPDRFSDRVAMRFEITQNATDAIVSALLDAATAPVAETAGEARIVPQHSLEIALGLIKTAFPDELFLIEALSTAPFATPPVPAQDDDRGMKAFNFINDLYRIKAEFPAIRLHGALKNAEALAALKSEAK